MSDKTADPDTRVTLYAGGETLPPGGVLYFGDERDDRLLHFIEHYPVESFATPQHRQTVKDVRLQLIAAIKRGFHHKAGWTRDEILKARIGTHDAPMSPETGKEHSD